MTKAFVTLLVSTEELKLLGHEGLVTREEGFEAIQNAIESREIDLQSGDAHLIQVANTELPILREALKAWS